MKTRSIASQLRAFRKARGLSQSQAAPVLGVPLKTLQNWEEERNAPRGLALHALQNLLASKPSKRLDKQTL